MGVDSGRVARHPAGCLSAALNSVTDEASQGGGRPVTSAENAGRAGSRSRVGHPAWFQEYARCEAESVTLCFYSTLSVPGLLQTKNYAGALFLARRPLLDTETIERWIAARLARQEILTRRPAPTVHAVVEESVLRRPIGGRRVQREQLEQLLRLGELRSTTIQVLPMDREQHAGMEGPYALLTPNGRQQVGYVEVQGTNRLLADPEEVRSLAARYACIRRQALAPRQSASLIRKILGGRR